MEKFQLTTFEKHSSLFSRVANQSIMFTDREGFDNHTSHLEGWESDALIVRLETTAYGSYVDRQGCMVSVKAVVLSESGDWVPAK